VVALFRRLLGLYAVIVVSELRVVIVGVAAEEAVGPPPSRSLFDDVYAKPEKIS